MMCGSSFKNKGVQAMLDMVMEILPSPLDIEGITGINPKTDQEVVRKPSYDEPFAGLDPIALGITARLIRDLNTALGATSIVVTHDVEETFAIADYVYFIANGRIGAQGTPDELNRSSDPFVRQFLDASPDGPVPFHYPGVELLDDFAAQVDAR
jgi:hypothetical protein